MVQRIPKIIHYCWFGGNPKSELILSCLESWKRFFPEYEIREWNESNYDVNKCAFVKEAYERGRWAFVSDYVRFDVLEQFGGIYFDTDVEVLREFPEELTGFEAFTGVESGMYVSPGLVLAARPHFPIVREMLELYEKTHFIADGQEHPVTVNLRFTGLLEDKGYVRNGQYQEIEGLRVYPAEVFAGFDTEVMEPDITENTLCMHHYASSWKSGGYFFKRSVQKILKKVFGVEGYRKMLMLVRKLRGQR